MRDSVIAITPDVSGAEWDAFVDAQPGASAYHRYEWGAIIARAFRHQTHYLAARVDGLIAGVLPLVAMDSRVFGRFIVSLPFVNYGGVLARDASIASALVRSATTVARREHYSHIELRHRAQQFPDLPCRTHKVAMELPLPKTPAALWDAFDRKLRNQIRKSQKSGLDLVKGGVELLDEFYAVFAVNMRDLGTPVYGSAFFREVLTTLGERAEVTVVRRDGAAVAAGLTVRYRDGIEMPWASAVRQSREWCANQLLYWTVIEHASESGLRRFDFGRSTAGDSHYEFKRQWGAQPAPLYWEYVQPGSTPLPDFNPSSAKYQRAVALWKRLPLPITRLVGPHIVRSIP